MDSTTTQKLHEVYGYFSHSADGMDGVHFARLCRDLNLELVSHNDIPNVPATAFDIVFARAKSPAKRRLDFNQFLIALDLIGQKLKLSIEEVIRAVCTISTEDQFTVRNVDKETSRAKGPARFYYDPTTYTGTHKFRKSFPKTNADDSPSGRAIDLKEIVNRDGSERWASAMSPKTPSTAVRRREPSSAQTRQAGDTTPLRGPERFFYDKTTYTGIHKQTSPTRSELADEKENCDQSPRRRSIRSSTAKTKNPAASLPETAAASVMNTPYMSSSIPGLMTCEEFLAAELNIMPIDNYFSSFLRK
jgi:hypothetical protein